MEFILRILFTGLIAFVPSDDGKEVTVLLLNAGHEHHASNGTVIPAHTPVLLARAGNCVGDCTNDDSAIAQYIYNGYSLSTAKSALQTALANGSAWKLDGSDLSIRKGSTNAADLPPLVVRNGVRSTVNGVPSIVPSTATEREDYSWIADLKQLCNGCTFNSAIMASQPPSNLVAARLRLRSGKVFTYSVARIGNNVTPVRFERLDGQGSASPYVQAVASWVGTDIAISGSDVEIVEASFNGGTGRSMKLAPDASGKVEVAVLNLPAFVPPATSSNPAPEVGKHFEMFYSLLNNPPASETRLVPRAGAPSNTTYPQVDWQLVHPQSAVYSELLNQLRLDVGRSSFDRVLCPPASGNYP